MYGVSDHNNFAVFGRAVYNTIIYIKSLPWESVAFLRQKTYLGLEPITFRFMSDSCSTIWTSGARHFLSYMQLIYVYIFYVTFDDSIKVTN